MAKDVVNKPYCLLLGRLFLIRMCLAFAVYLSACFPSFTASNRLFQSLLNAPVLIL